MRGVWLLRNRLKCKLSAANTGRAPAAAPATAPVAAANAVSVKTPPHIGIGSFSCTCTPASVCSACTDLVSTLHEYLGRLPSKLRDYAADMQEYLNTLEQTVGPKHALTAACSLRLALARVDLRKWTRLPGSTRYLYRARALYAEDGRLRAASSPGALAEHGEVLGGVHHARGDLPSAKRAYLWALSCREERLRPPLVPTPESLIYMAKTEYHLGVCVFLMGDNDASESYFKILHKY
eukprot:tig00000133_g7694.t1